MIEALVLIGLMVLVGGWLKETNREPKRVKAWRKRKSAGKRKGGRR